MKTTDIKFQELCEEIDFWKAEAKFYEKKYKEEIQNRVLDTNERLLEAKKGVANALMFALSVKDNEDGSLSISSENRKELAKNYKK